MKLEEMEYPGRGVIIGLTKDKDPFCSYFITGRSSSSQARKLIADGKTISTEPTNLDAFSEGNPDLLVYNAIAWGNGIMAVSNGKQTDSIITKTICGENPTLAWCTRQWNYEPDAPNYTPRISGRILIHYLKDHNMELGIIKREKKNTCRKGFHIHPSVTSSTGEGFAITTYAGANQEPLPSFEGEPFPVRLHEASAEGICKELSDLLRPEFRVSIATVIFGKLGYDISKHIINFRGE